MSELAPVQAITLAHAEASTARRQTAWKKTRLAHWSRTSTARWLNDRSPSVLAWLRRRPGHWPDESRQIGYWLKDCAVRTFDRAHTVLAAAPDDSTRESLLPSEVLK